MGKVAYILGLLLLLEACKKEAHSNICAGIDTSDQSFPQAKMDSATFASKILGVWYLRMASDIPYGHEHAAGSICYADSSHPFVFLADGRLIMTLSDGRKDTVPYSFYTDSTGLIDPQRGQFSFMYNPECSISYNPNYLALDTQDRWFDTYILGPAFIIARK